MNDGRARTHRPGFVEDGRRSVRAIDVLDVPCAVRTHERNVALVLAITVVTALRGQSTRRADSRPRQRTPVLGDELVVDVVCSSVAIPHGSGAARHDASPLQDQNAARASRLRVVAVDGRPAVCPLAHAAERGRASRRVVGRTPARGRLLCRRPRAVGAGHERVAGRTRVRSVLARLVAAARRPLGWLRRGAPPRARAGDPSAAAARGQGGDERDRENPHA